MNPNDETSSTKTPRKPIANDIALMAFAVESGAVWKQSCLVASMPESWIDRFERENRKQPHVRPEWSLPTRSLAEILIAVEPAIIHVDWNLRSESFIVAFEGVDPRVLTAAIAAWATTQITSEIDWFGTLDHHEINFTSADFNVLEHQPRPNGTAAPAPHVYNLLPTFVAKHIADAGLSLLDRSQGLILGPPRSNGRRDVVLWPPIKIENDDSGQGLVTAKITVHIETVPNHPRPHLHADLSVSRFPLTPVTWVPQRGATLWLHAPNGFLRHSEPHTLLAARVRQHWDGKNSHWKWLPGIGQALANLTHLPFPSPDKVFAQPAIAAQEGAIRSFVLYSGGSKSEAVDYDDAPGDGPRRPKSLLHAARTGFVPGDHLEVHNQLIPLLAPLGIARTGVHHRVGSKTARQIKVRFDPATRYAIELWTHTDNTKDAIIATLEHHLGLTRLDDVGDPRRAQFGGAFNLDLLLRDGTTLAAGIPRPDDKFDLSQALGLYASRTLRDLGDCDNQQVVAILELGDDRHFTRIGRVDPKSTLKKVFARSGRRLQCLRPVSLFKPPKNWHESSRRERPAPYPGTNFDKSAIHRCAAAINDALRQLGRLGTYELPPDLPQLEHIGIWLHHDKSSSIPLAIRHNGVNEPMALLAGGPDGAMLEVAYRDLPKVLANGGGQVKGTGDQQKAIIAEFLNEVLGIGSAPHQHDRVAFVRSSSFRNWGWDWMQDRHLTPDHLVPPGAKIEDALPPTILHPADCPGLRIVRVRDASSQLEVPRAFGPDPEIYADRISGLFKFNDYVYYAINPRSDQMQTRLDNTKLNPDLHRNFTRAAANPQPLELAVAFKQPGDEADTLAALTARLRRVHSHTDQDTRYPSVLHLCSLADEYI